MTRAAPSLLGTLYVVATPIGNLEDLSPRARSVLDEADLIAAEDTRRTAGLLSSVSARSRLISYHEHNEAARTPELLERLRDGAVIALVSDAGVPLISDPGLTLVAAALMDGIPIVSVPGPSAVTAALSISGLPTDRFVFEGFLPRKSAARARRLAELADEPRTLVFFESVHRVAATLAALADAFGTDRPAAVARELTKLHEQLRRATLGELAAAIGHDVPALGEFVIVVGGAAAAAAADDAEVRRVYAVLVDEIGSDRAVALTARLTRMPRNAVYRLTRT